MTEPQAAPPQDAEYPWLRLHPDILKSAALLTLGLALAGGVPAAIALAGISWALSLAIVVPGALIVVGGGTGIEAVRYHVTRYRVTDSRVEMVTGLVFKQHRSLARERIRSVDLSAHPLYRFFGLVKVKVGTGETGSGTGSTGQRSLTLDAVGRAEADRLRAELLRRGSGTAEPDEGRLATWRPAWLRFAPLSFLTPMLAAAVVGVSFQVSDWFGRGGLPVEVTMDLADRHGPWTVALLGLAGILLVGVVGSLAFQAEAWWNHRLDREPGGTLRVRRGLLVNRSLSLEEQRIRGIEIVEPLGIRSAGAARLDVVAIGLKTEQGGSDLTTLVPAAPRAVIAAAADAVIGPTSVDLLPHPKAARGRRLRRAAAFIAALAVAVTAVHLLWPVPRFWSTLVIAVAVLLAAASVRMAFDSYASLGHGVDGRYLVTRRGSLRRSTVYLDRSGIIGWRISQSLFQRRLGLMTLDATSAAGQGHYAIVDADQDEIVRFAAEAAPGLLDPFAADQSRGERT